MCLYKCTNRLGFDIRRGKTPVVTRLSAAAPHCAARYDTEGRRYIPYPACERPDAGRHRLAKERARENDEREVRVAQRRCRAQNPEL